MKSIYYLWVSGGMRAVNDLNVLHLKNKVNNTYCHSLSNVANPVLSVAFLICVIFLLH